MPDKERDWDSLPEHLKTSRLAYTICPQGAADAADALDTLIFWGRYGFFNLDLHQVGAFLWRKFGEEMQARTDDELLAWMRHMGFRDHAAFDGMSDDEVIQTIRRNEQIMAGHMNRYPRSHDFSVAFQNAGMTPSQDPETLRAQIRTLFRTDAELNAIIPEMLERSPRPSPEGSVESPQ